MSNRAGEITDPCATPMLDTNENSPSRIRFLEYTPLHKKKTAGRGPESDFLLICRSKI